MKFYCEEAGRALAELKSTPDGLTDAEATRRLAETMFPKPMLISFIREPSFLFHSDFILGL